ncbi:cytochrome c maturation protein CcmE [Aureimonas psammosilenae]|uniref:cytochrome c maturation protein CcmE n=1 Tax=Aureimonas psammosilenae TaxID=2495496 RepID=UPI00126092B2|nr:cytochrome c maturation protein CcmE [Aureimonas psammosilenae]
MTRKGKRLLTVGAMFAVVAFAGGLVAYASKDSFSLYSSPTDIGTKMLPPGQRIRLGGLVEKGSVERGTGDTVRFRVTDSVQSVPVTYRGILPDLFREEQGVIAEGSLGPDRVFAADTILAKHDETYMPKEIVDDLKKRGLWEDGKPKATPVAANGGAGL